jgi:hypothetical protein
MNPGGLTGFASAKPLVVTLKTFAPFQNPHDSVVFPEHLSVQVDPETQLPLPRLKLLPQKQVAPFLTAPHFRFRSAQACKHNLVVMRFHEVKL